MGGGFVRGWLAAVAAAGIIAGSVAPARAQSGSALALSAGAYDVARTRPAEVGFEYRLSSRAWKLVPAIGGVVTEDGTFWAYAGLRRPFRIGRDWLLTPGFGVSLYDEGGAGKDLGGPLQFRSSLELSRPLGGGQSLGLAVYHLSNASIYKDNPGSNSVVLRWALPVSSPAISPPRVEAAADAGLLPLDGAWRIRRHHDPERLGSR